jgi:RecA/RadA recombinase
MSNLMSKLLKAGSVDSTILSESDMFKEQDLIKTSLPIINVAYSGKIDGGFGSGLTILAGESKTFKTAFSLYCMKAYLDKYEDGIGILYDSEGGCNPQYIKSFGIDPNRIIHIPVEHVEQLKFDFVKKLNEINKGDHVFFMVDSIGQIASKKETDDATDEKSVADMTRAKAIRSLLRLITVQLNKKLLPCFMINHVYQEMGMFPKTIIPGGCLLAGTQIKMFDGSLKKIEDVKEGDLVLTLEGIKPVEHTWDPHTLVDGTPECFEIEFDDGYKVVCSDKHPFLTQHGWVKAKDLTDEHEITCVVS